MTINITSLSELFEAFVAKNLCTSNQSWLDNLEKQFCNQDLFFRGQSAKFESIVPGIARKPGFINNEYNMFSETVNSRCDDLKMNTSPFDILSKMQHYGLPTRLIDFSINPLIALFL